MKDHVRHDFVRLSVGDTVAQALAGVQKGRPEGRIVYFYVVDEKGRLEGVIPTRRLLLSPPQTPLAGDHGTAYRHAARARRRFWTPVNSSPCNRLLALPVVDHEGRIVGVVDVELYTDEISDLIRQQENEDIFQLIGVRLARLRQASVPAAFRGRFPWLLCNIAGGLACAVLAAAFQDVLDQVIVLADVHPRRPRPWPKA